jgi:Peptidase family M20/M25/M40
MDVVPANPETWERDPFTLEYDESSDKVFGRGTTDCLGKRIKHPRLILWNPSLTAPVLAKAMLQ